MSATSIEAAYHALVSALSDESAKVVAIDGPIAGCFLCICDPSGRCLKRYGHLGSKDSYDETVIGDIVAQASGDLPHDAIRFGGVSFHLVVIRHLEPLKEDPLNWEPGKDGVCFQWGQDHMAYYLPLETNDAGMTKQDTMHRLCCMGAGLPSNFWRKPEGLVWRMECETYPQKEGV
jgi:hypothetical protein